MISLREITTTVMGQIISYITGFLIVNLGLNCRTDNTVRFYLTSGGNREGTVHSLVQKMRQGCYGNAW